MHLLPRYFEPSSFYSYKTGSTHFFSQTSWRLLEHLDINNTVGQVFFGSTYNVVTPAGYLNPNAIKSHNGYKEIYLAGGLTGLILYLILFLIYMN